MHRRRRAPDHAAAAIGRSRGLKDLRSVELRHATEPLGYLRPRELLGIAAIARSHTLSGLRAAELRRASG
jgi:hypothetical protein